MKPEVLTALIAAFGLAVNLLWALHNLHVRSEIRKMIDELKDYVRNECVNKDFCNERHGEILRRLEVIGS